MANPLSAADLDALERRDGMRVEGVADAVIVVTRTELDALIHRLREAEYDRDVIAPANKDDAESVFEINRRLQAQIVELQTQVSDRTSAEMREHYSAQAERHSLEWQASQLAFVAGWALSEAESYVRDGYEGTSSFRDKMAAIQEKRDLLAELRLTENATTHKAGSDV